MKARAAWMVVGMLGIATVAFAQPRPWASKVPLEARKATNPLPPGAETVAAGAIVYANTCLPCHGETAQGDGPAAALIKPKPKPLVDGPKLTLPDGVIFWVVSNGLGENSPMASFREALTDTERWQAISYLHSLAAPAPAPMVQGSSAKSTTTAKQP